jgi:hypothetical protein
MHCFNIPASVMTFWEMANESTLFSKAGMISPCSLNASDVMARTDWKAMIEFALMFWY